MLYVTLSENKGRIKCVLGTDYDHLSVYNIDKRRDVI